MYLIHSTEEKYIKKILLDNELKSPKMTNKISWGSGIYDSKHQKHIFFSVIKEKFMYAFPNPKSILIYLIFDSKLLFNRKYYISNNWVAFPEYTLNKEGKNMIKYGKNYIIKYPRYYKKTNKILNKLSNDSMKVQKDDPPFNMKERIRFSLIFNQVAINNKCSLKYLKFIILNKNIPKTILKILKNKYPNVKIIFKK